MVEKNHDTTTGVPEQAFGKGHFPLLCLVAHGAAHVRMLPGVCVLVKLPPPLLPLWRIFSMAITNSCATVRGIPPPRKQPILYTR